VIVTVIPDDDAPWRELVRAHAVRHPAIPVIAIPASDGERPTDLRGRLRARSGRCRLVGRSALADHGPTGG
jgi:hypothetical protein